MSSVYAKRFEAVFLCNHPKGPLMSYTVAAKYIKKSKSFVKNWFERYKANKTVDDLPERGKSRATTIKKDNAIIKLFERLPALRLREAKAILAEKRVNISINTIRQRLAESIIKYRSTRQKPLLSETHMENRKAWAAENLDRDWSNVIFSDEASFWAWVPIKYAWSTVGSRLLQRTVKHPVKVHVWGCFSQRSFGCLELFT